MAWILKVVDEFAAAHYLPDYHGKCETMHGHNYTVEVEIRVHELDSGGMGHDFGEIRSALRQVMPDHTLLNDILEHPSAENISRYIYEALKPRFPGLFRVTVWENARQSASYSAEE